MSTARVPQYDDSAGDGQRWTLSWLLVAPFGLCVAHYLCVRDLVLLRVVHRTLAAVSYDAAAYVFCASWRPRWHGEVADVLSQADGSTLLVDTIIEDSPFSTRRLIPSLVPRAGLSCASSAAACASLLSSLRSIDLSDCACLVDEDVDRLLMQRCSRLTSLDLSGVAATLLSTDCRLSISPHDIASCSTISTLRLSSQFSLTRTRAWPEGVDVLPLDVSCFPQLTALHHKGRCDDDTYAVLSRLPLLHTLTIDELLMDDVQSLTQPQPHAGSQLMSLTDLTLSRVVHVQQLCLSIGTHLRLRRLSICMESDPIEDCPVHALTALLGQQSACHQTLQELRLEAVESIPLAALYRLATSLPALHVLETLHCMTDLRPSPAATQHALQGMLDAKRHVLTSLALPKQLSSTLPSAGLMMQLLRDGAPSKLRLFCTASEWNAAMSEHNMHSRRQSALCRCPQLTLMAIRGTAESEPEKLSLPFLLLP